MDVFALSRQNAHGMVLGALPAILLFLVSSLGCRQDATQPASPAATQARAVPPSAAEAHGLRPSSVQAPPPGTVGELFTDVTEALGITNPAGPWPDGTFQTPEITPGGVALFDYDGDGRLDIYQVNHCAPGSFDKLAPNRLFHQEPDGKFREVPGAAGLDAPGFGHGVAIGDIDNDGDLDVFVTNYGENRLYLNDGQGHFNEVTKAAGVTSNGWSSSAGFLDYDRDGYLDLFVVRFAKFDPNKKCKASANADEYDYCGPHTFEGVSDILFHNNGDGTFSDVSDKAGITQAGRGWGLCCADLTGDGWVDVYVANDEEPAQLWVNQHDGTFVDEALIRGCAFNGAGRVEAGMGVGVGDIDGDGLPDLFKTHITSETNTLYLSGGLRQQDGASGGFSDRTSQAGMGGVDRPYTGWGTGFFDFDHDGDLDIAVVNGRVSKGPVKPGAALGKFWNRFAEPKFLFANDGHGHFTDVSGKTGVFGSRPEISRGLAFGDIDGDGDIDLVVQNLDNSLRIFRNNAPPRGTHWLIVRPMTGRRDAYGAQLTLRAKERSWVRLAHPTYSFLSSSDPRAHFGLGPVSQVDSLEILWPDGKKEIFEVPAVDRVVTVQQGTGKPEIQDAVR